MYSLIFTLLFGLLTGIAGFVGRAPFETVLMLGLIGIAHLHLVQTRRARTEASAHEMSVSRS